MDITRISFTGSADGEGVRIKRVKKLSVVPGGRMCIHNTHNNDVTSFTTAMVIDSIGLLSNLICLLDFFKKDSLELLDKEQRVRLMSYVMAKAKCTVYDDYEVWEKGKLLGVTQAVSVDMFTATLCIYNKNNIRQRVRKGMSTTAHMRKRIRRGITTTINRCEAVEWEDMTDAVLWTYGGLFIYSHEGFNYETTEIINKATRSALQFYKEFLEEIII